MRTTTYRSKSKATKHNNKYKELASEQIFPTVEIVSTGYKPRRVSAPRSIASLPAYSEKGRNLKIEDQCFLISKLQIAGYWTTCNRYSEY